LRLAESWDNVGLLLEAPTPAAPVAGRNRVLLTIDLTSSVMEEALKEKAGFIVTYHPPIFRPLSSLTLSRPISASLLRCAQAGISVYSPHTALDAVKGGINDWLASAALPPTLTVRCLQEKEPESGSGSGRLAVLKNSVPFQELVAGVKRGLNLPNVQIGVPSGGERHVSSVAICAGSGGSMLRDVDAGVYFTGEMAHHEVLEALAKNHFVILCGHTNTERGYLPTLAARLQKELEIEGGSDTDVFISSEDCHPLVTV